MMTISIASLLASYLACTTPAHLDTKEIDHTQCLATDDIQQYNITAVQYVGDKAEITLDLMDNTTAILWVYRDALDRSEAE